jgi:hypothetical protein
VLRKKPVYQRFIARQQLRKYATVLEPLLGSGPRNNGSTVGSGVLYVVRPEAISLHRQSSEWVSVKLSYSSVPDEETILCVITVIEQATSEVSWGPRFWCTRNKWASKDHQQRTYNCVTRRLAFDNTQMRKCVLYLVCVMSARVQVNSLVKSEESTFIVATCHIHVTILLW